MANNGSKGLKYDTQKLRPSLIPVEALQGITEVLEFGAKKYSPGNWKKVEHGEQRYFDALMRHLWAYQSGEVVDDESNLHHLKHAGCCLLFMLYFIEQENQKVFDPRTMMPDDEELATYIGGVRNASC